MKKLTTILISILTTLSVFSQQIPQSFSFQGIAKDEFGQAMQEGWLVSLRFTIYEGSGTAGTLLYQEIHNSIEIKQGGVISVNVGNGSAINGNFIEIIWNSQKTLAVGIDESNGSFFSALGNLLILSAPYSFYSENTKPFPLQELSDVNAFGITDGQVLQWNGSEWQPVDFVSSQNYTAGTGISIIGNEIINTGDTDASDDFSGDYSDLINKPVIPIDFSELTDNSNLLFDGNYNSLSNLPTLFSGDYADLSSKPDFTGWDTNQADDFSGNYSDLLNKPIIPLDFSELTDNSNLLFDGDYNSLSNLPTLFSGNYADLTNKPVSFSGEWNALTGTAPNVSIFTNDAGYLTTASENQNLNSVLTESNDAGNTSIINVSQLGVGTASPVSSAAIEINSTTQGFLPPRMTELEIANIIDPVNGLMVFNNDDNKVYVFSENLNNWRALSFGLEMIEPSESPIATGTVNDIDGNTYNYITIGTQVWMTENLRVTHYADGSEIDVSRPAPAVYTDAEWGALGDNDTDKAYCFYSDNISSDYGALYTYAAATNGDSGGTTQGICPNGWHLPRDAEWKELEKHIGLTNTEAAATGWRGTDVGGKLKEMGTTHWNSPNTGGTNNSGFSTLPGGYRYGHNGVFENAGVYAWLWSATQGDASTAWYRLLLYNKAEVGRNDDRSKSTGISVRCIKD